MPMALQTRLDKCQHSPFSCCVRLRSTCLECLSHELRARNVTATSDFGLWRTINGERTQTEGAARVYDQNKARSCFGAFVIERLYLYGTIIAERRLETFMARKRPGKVPLFRISHTPTVNVAVVKLDAQQEEEEEFMANPPLPSIHSPCRNRWCHVKFHVSSMTLPHDYVRTEWVVHAADCSSNVCPLSQIKHHGTSVMLTLPTSIDK